MRSFRNNFWSKNKINIFLSCLLASSRHKMKIFSLLYFLFSFVWFTFCVVVKMASKFVELMAVLAEISLENPDLLYFLFSFEIPQLNSTVGLFNFHKVWITFEGWRDFWTRILVMTGTCFNEVYSLYFIIIFHHFLIFYYFIDITWNKFLSP